MQTYTIDDIKNIEPCYCPTKFLTADWAGTLVDILDVEDCPPQDRIWVVTQLLDDKTNRLFAVWCAREALKMIPNPDPRSIEACNVAEKFATGEATEVELRDANTAARAAEAAAAAWAAKAAKAAACATAYAADAVVAYAAARAATKAAAARAATKAAWEAQIAQLKKMITEAV